MEVYPMLHVGQELLNVSFGDIILQGKAQFKVTYPRKIVPEFSEDSGVIAMEDVINAVKREFQRIKKVCS
jgi:hypothetical protein